MTVAFPAYIYIYEEEGNLMLAFYNRYKVDGGVQACVNLREANLSQVVPRVRNGSKLASNSHNFGPYAYDSFPFKTG